VAQLQKYCLVGVPERSILHRYATGTWPPSLSVAYTDLCSSTAPFLTAPSRGTHALVHLGMDRSRKFACNIGGSHIRFRTPYLLLSDVRDHRSRSRSFSSREPVPPSTVSLSQRSPRSLVDVMFLDALQSSNIRNLSHWIQIAWMDEKGAYRHLQDLSSWFAVDCSVALVACFSVAQTTTVDLLGAYRRHTSQLSLVC